MSKAIQTDLSLENHRIRKLKGGTQDSDAASFAQSKQSKSISILSPQAGDNITLFYVEADITIENILSVLQGSGSRQVTYSIYYDSSRSATGTQVVNAESVTSITSADTATIATAGVPGGSWVWLNVDSVVATVVEFHLTIVYSIDA